ncbi:MAG: glycosyltransferase [Chitinophagaceae bacterium]|nr:glycosyltransferase [Chitinophagaceae bacterium]
MAETVNPHISVIIPVYNEYEGIPVLLQSLGDFFGEHSHLNAEVIFVNDGSRDQSLDRLLTGEHRNYHARVINLARNSGSHAALRAGILNAKGDYICFNYADLQDPLELVLRMKEGMDAGHDIVWAYRENAKMSFLAKQFSRMYARLMKKYVFSNFPEKGFDILMFNRKVANELNKNIEPNSSVFLQIMGMGFKQMSFSYEKRARAYGESKWTYAKKIKLFIDSFVAFSYAPIRFVTIIGIAMFLLGIILSLYIVARKLFFQDLIVGWTATVCILLIGFGITNISLGIIAEYLWRTLDASRKRPVFIVDEIYELENKTEPISK